MQKPFIFALFMALSISSLCAQNASALLSHAQESDSLSVGRGKASQIAGITLPVAMITYGALSFGSSAVRKHWVSDVVAGAGIGILSVKIVYLTYPCLQKTFGKKDKKFQTTVLPGYNNGNLSLTFSCTF